MCMRARCYPSSYNKSFFRDSTKTYENSGQRKLNKGVICGLVGVEHLRPVCLSLDAVCEGIIGHKCLAIKQRSNNSETIPPRKFNKQEKMKWPLEVKAAQTRPFVYFLYSLPCRIDIWAKFNLFCFFFWLYPSVKAITIRLLFVHSTLSNLSVLCSLACFLIGLRYLVSDHLLLSDPATCKASINAISQPSPEIITQTIISFFFSLSLSWQLQWRSVTWWRGWILNVTSPGTCSRLFFLPSQ